MNRLPNNIEPFSIEESLQIIYKECNKIYSPDKEDSEIYTSIGITVECSLRIIVKKEFPSINPERLLLYDLIIQIENVIVFKVFVSFLHDVRKFRNKVNHGLQVNRNKNPFRIKNLKTELCHFLTFFFKEYLNQEMPLEVKEWNNYIENGDSTNREKKRKFKYIIMGVILTSGLGIIGIIEHYKLPLPDKKIYQRISPTQSNKLDTQELVLNTPKTPLTKKSSDFLTTQNRHNFLKDCELTKTAKYTFINPSQRTIYVSLSNKNKFHESFKIDSGGSLEYILASGNYHYQYDYYEITTFIGNRVEGNIVVEQCKDKTFQLNPPLAYWHKLSCFSWKEISVPRDNQYMIISFQDSFRVAFSKGGPMFTGRSYRLIPEGAQKLYLLGLSDMTEVSIQKYTPQLNREIPSLIQFSASQLEDARKSKSRLIIAFDEVTPEVIEERDYEGHMGDEWVRLNVLKKSDSSVVLTCFGSKDPKFGLMYDGKDNGMGTITMHTFVNGRTRTWSLTLIGNCYQGIRPVADRKKKVVVDISIKACEIIEK